MEQLSLFELQEQRGNQMIRYITESPWKILDCVNWDFTGETTQYLTHTFHSYPARFIPQIPNMFIQLFTQEGDTVLDPFAGCGTTLVEAMLLNRKAIGVDMNPLACLISKTKTTLVRQRDLDRLWAIVVQMQSIFGLREDADVEYLTQIGTFNDTDMKFPKRKISDLFTPDVMAELRTIKEHIEELKDNETLFNLALVALSATIRVVIESERRNGFYHTFRQKVKMMIAVLEELNRRIHQSNVTALPGDARQLPISDTSIDLVVPLLTLMHWTITASIQYNIAWLGMDYKAFQRQEIGGHSQLLLS